MILAIIAYGEVPPDIGGTTDTVVYPFDAFFRDIGYDTVSGPHDLDGGIELGTEDIQIVGLSP